MSPYDICSWLYELLLGPEPANLENPDRPATPAPTLPPPATQPPPRPDTPPIECGCCFGDYEIAATYQCPSNHPFCATCIQSYVEGRLLQNQMEIRCFDGSGCDATFHPSVLLQSLLPRTYKRLEQLWEERDIREANIPDLASCPFCHFHMIVEASVKKDPLFRCLNVEDGCGKVSCRKCGKEDHSPRTCKQERKRSEGARQRIEEAMSGALIRKCPGCKRAIIKEAGCNRMSCPDPNCKRSFCYLCRKDITRQRYGHFDRKNPLSRRCYLFDQVPLEDQHAREVDAARERATATRGTKRRSLWRAPRDLNFRIPGPLSRLVRKVVGHLKRD